MIKVVIGIKDEGENGLKITRTVSVAGNVNQTEINHAVFDVAWSEMLDKLALEGALPDVAQMAGQDGINRAKLAVASAFGRQEN